MMVAIEIDPYPVSELPTRFSIGRTALYDRFNALDVVTTKQGNKAYISQEQLQWLDALDVHLKDGGEIADFARLWRPYGESAESAEVSEQDEQAYPVGSNASSSKLSRSQASGVFDFLRLDVQTVVGVVREGLVNPLISGIKESLLVVFPAPLSRVERGLRLSHLRELEEAYEKRWFLSTAELADLLGLAAKTVRRKPEQFEQAGFTFTRSQDATSPRGGVAWQIGKLNSVRTINLD